MTYPLAIIGDVHGCLWELDQLVTRLKAEGVIRIVLVGDLMDKGPNPVECVQYARRHELECVLGNHEEKHVRWRRHVERQQREPNYKIPMRPLSKLYQEHNARLTAEDITWLQRLPLYLRILPRWVVVHGGFFGGATPVEQVNDKKMWDKVIRLRWVDKDTGKAVPTEYDENGKVVGQPKNSVHWTEKYDGTDCVVYGHEAHSLSAVRMDHLPQDVECYGIDTGCVHGGHLTALVLDKPKPLSITGDPSVRTVQQKARQVYEEAPCHIPA